MALAAAGGVWKTCQAEPCVPPQIPAVSGAPAAAGKPTNSAADTVLLSKNRNCTVENEPQLQYFWRKVEFVL